jgi:hypothetical protein
MEYEKPTPENVISSIDLILKKEHDTKTRVKFFLGILKIMEEEPERFKLLVLKQISKLVNEL